MLPLIPIVLLNAALADADTMVQWSPQQLKAGVELSELSAPAAKRVARQGQLAGALGLKGYKHRRAVLFTADDADVAAGLLDDFERTKAVMDEIEPPPADDAEISTLFHVVTRQHKVVIHDRLFPPTDGAGPDFPVAKRRTASFDLAGPELIILADEELTGSLRERPVMIDRRIARAMLDRRFELLPFWLREAMARDIASQVIGLPVIGLPIFGLPIGIDRDSVGTLRPQIWDEQPVRGKDREAKFGTMTAPSGGAQAQAAPAGGAIDELRRLRTVQFAHALRVGNPQALRRLVVALRAASLQSVDTAGGDEPAEKVMDDVLGQLNGKDWRSWLR